ncbi:MAG: DUF4097 family beta strand repeat-containing protein [Eubacteriales bacterium]
MKKKPITIIVLICLGIFLVFGITSSVLMRSYLVKNGGFDFDFVGAEVIDNAEVSLDGVDTIKITTLDADVFFTQSDELLTSELYYLGTPRANQVKLSSYVEGSTAYIEIDYPITSMQLWRSSLTVGLPSDFEGQIIIKSASGDIHADLPNTLSSLDVSSVSGDIAMSLIEASDIALTTQSGLILLDSDVANTLYANSKSGDLKLDLSLDSSSQVTLETISGDVNLSCNAPCITDIKTTSGDIYIDLPDDSVIQLNYTALDGDYSGGVNTSSDGPLYNISSISGDLSFE